MNPIHVHPTDDDVAFGLRQSNSRCALVLAIKSACPEAERIIVTRERITFSVRGDDMRYAWKTPRAGARFIDAFDGDESQAVTARPTFTLDPAQAIRAWPVEHQGGPDRMKRQAGRPRKGSRRASYRPPVQV